MQRRPELLKTDFAIIADGYGVRITYMGQVVMSEGARHSYYRRGKPNLFYWDVRGEVLIDHILDTRWELLAPPTRIIIQRTFKMFSKRWRKTG